MVHAGDLMTDPIPRRRAIRVPLNRRQATMSEDDQQIAGTAHV